jgi:hypothetical protein
LSERKQRAIVRRTLDDHVVIGPQEVLEQERVRLHRTVCDEHALGVYPVPFRDPGAQARVADRGAIGCGSSRVVLERACSRVAEALHVDDVERRGAPCEGDRRLAGSTHAGQA